jgi:isoamyl acetate esterase
MRAAVLSEREPPQELDRSFDTTRDYAEAVKDVAREEEVAVLDVWTKLWDAAGHEETNLKKYLYDGLHLNKAGYDVRIFFLCKIFRDDELSLPPRLYWMRFCH